ncbi:MAG: hypothetical protein ACK4GR_04905 [bacterium]
MNENFSIEQRISQILKKYNLENVGIIFMESMIPFRRILGHIVVFNEPFLSLFFNDKILQEVRELFYNEERYNNLYNLLKNEDSEENL